MPKTSNRPCIYAGLSGLQLPIPKSLYPPPFETASRLTYYGFLFNSIEINSTFYKLPRSTTIEKWRQSVQENFRFTFKVWKEITHVKRLNFREENVYTFLKTIDFIGPKKGCLLIQFPPGFNCEYHTRLEDLLYCINEADNKWKIAVEFRNNTWYNNRTYDLLQTHKAALVIHDLPASSTPLMHNTSDHVYMRLHGPSGDYRDSYSQESLNRYASQVKAWIKKRKQVYIYFNNTAGDAINNLNTINGMFSDRF